jgi:hypothetical protein
VQVHQPAAAAAAGQGVPAVWLGAEPDLQPDAVTAGSHTGTQLRGESQVQCVVMGLRGSGAHDSFAESDNIVQPCSASR